MPYIILSYLRDLLRPHQDLLLENITLRQQINVLRRRNPKPAINPDLPPITLYPNDLFPQKMADQSACPNSRQKIWFSAWDETVTPAEPRPPQ